MRSVIFYIILISFWLENSLHFEFEKLFGLSMGLSLKNLSIFMLFIAWIYAIRSQNSLYNRNKINIYMVLLAFFIISSNLIEVLLYNNYSNIRQFKVLLGQIIELKNFINPWIFFFLLSHILQTKKECKNGILGIMLLMSITAATGVIDQFTSIDLGTQKQLVTYEGRSAGFGEANQYGAFLVLILPISLSYTLLTKNIRRKIAYSLIFLLGFIGLISTVSRGSFVGFIFAVCVFFMLSFRSNLIRFTRIFFVVLFIVPIIGIITYSVLPSGVKDAFKYKVIEKADKSKHNINPYRQKNKSFLDIYTSGRTERWEASFKGFSESPIWGKGNYTVKNILMIKPHNDYLKILIKYGIIGFILYIMIYINIFRQISFNLKKSSENEDKIIFLGFLSGFMGYMVCMFGVGLNIPRYIFWIYTAAVSKYSQFDSFEIEEIKEIN